MKQLKKPLLIATLTLAVHCLFAQNLSNYQLVADYPFTSDLSDQTGNYGDASATNTSFAQGGIYSNGVYSGSGQPNACSLQTPQITGQNTGDFAIHLDFNADFSNNNTILVCGNSWRWMTVYTNNLGNLEVRVSKTDGFDQVITTTGNVDFGFWHNVVVKYNNVSNVVEVYQDNALVGSGTLNASLNHQNDFDFSNSDGSSGVTYKGHWKNLKIYKDGSVGIEENLENMIDLYYSNQQIVLNAPEGSDYAIYNVSGNLIQQGKLSMAHTTIDTHDFPVGICIVQLQNNGLRKTEKLYIH